MPHTYTKVTGGKLFKNETHDQHGNPRKGPPLSVSNCEVLEDLKKGDKVDIAAWLNLIEGTNEKEISITVTKKTLVGPAPSQPSNDDDIPWG
jgi:hypothetical protein